MPIVNCAPRAHRWTHLRKWGVGGPAMDKLSAIVRTAKTIGCFPNQVAPIDWVPVDTVTKMLLSFSLRPAQEEPQVLIMTWFLTSHSLRTCLLTSCVSSWVISRRSRSAIGGSECSEMWRIRVFGM
ncbi:hypothetical protein GGR54DRAFT_591480 [Hypoxylon sp. NC1633]|nr:hypothetical protein GGR54DRAFT_591480 [Hypoxylon sp. NC1633]